MFFLVLSFALRVLAAACAIYGAVAFIEWELNPALWREELRAFAAVIAAFLWLLLMLTAESDWQKYKVRRQWGKEWR